MTLLNKLIEINNNEELKDLLLNINKKEDKYENKDKKMDDKKIDDKENNKSKELISSIEKDLKNINLNLLEDVEDKASKIINILEEKYPELTQLIKFKLCESLNGPSLTKDLAHIALNTISKEYKRKECKFKYDESKQISKRYGVEFTKFNEFDWWYGLNICYYLFEDICKDNIQMCARLTYSWLNDMAIDKGKAFYHYMGYLKEKNI